jgi:hypothetical protein
MKRYDEVQPVTDVLSKATEEHSNGLVQAVAEARPRFTGRPRRLKDQRRRERGVFEKVPGTGVWWIRYIDAQGRYRREKVGTWTNARDLYHKRKTQAFEGTKLPEKLRRATVTFAEIARDALTYSKVHKAGTSYRCDASRMEVLLAWFREYPAESITAQDIERQFQKQEWAPATPNRYRALLSLTYRLAIRNGKVKENPARQVAHRHEDNTRIRFLSADEEKNLRKAIEKRCPERLPEFRLRRRKGTSVLVRARARGCKGLKLQLALFASHVRQPSRNGRSGHAHRARASWPQNHRNDRALFSPRTEAHTRSS